MKSPDNVLLGIAFFLLAGVILYNVFTADVETTNVEEESTSVVLTTEVTTTAAPDVVAASTKVNINTASAEELMSLSGIGPTKAQAIVDYRTSIGAFSSVDELINVSGIGEKTLAKIRDEITV
ncbi:MAG: helix-hairpin-helix domain-containing protein [Clostridia bacterium]|nr:helix-hairpin-helix domain-containing protein [Clostridia bacterium]